MKLLVSFKMCSDLELLREEDIEITEGMGIDTHFLPNIINCYDESALELALRLRDRADMSCFELTAFTVGNEQTEITLKSLRALGYLHTVRAENTNDGLRFSPETVAQTIAEYIRNNPQDCVLMGREAPNGNHGVMAQLTALYTGYPLIGPIIDIISAGEDSAVVLVSDEGSIRKQEVKMPCILCVGNAVISKLRVATLKDRMKVSKSESEHAELCIADASWISVPVTLSQYSAKRSGYRSQLAGEEAIMDVLCNGLQKGLDLI